MQIGSGMGPNMLHNQIAVALDAPRVVGASAGEHLDWSTDACESFEHARRNRRLHLPMVVGQQPASNLADSLGWWTTSI